MNVRSQKSSLGLLLYIRQKGAPRVGIEPTCPCGTADFCATMWLFNPPQYHYANGAFVIFHTRLPVSLLWGGTTGLNMNVRSQKSSLGLLLYIRQKGAPRVGIEPTCPGGQRIFVPPCGSSIRHNTIMRTGHLSYSTPACLSASFGGTTGLNMNVRSQKSSLGLLLYMQQKCAPRVGIEPTCLCRQRIFGPLCGSSIRHNTIM